MVKILITGGAGFVPSSTAEKLLQDPNNFVVLVDNFLTGRKENVPNHPNCKFINHINLIMYIITLQWSVY
jgi:nucleoside-diphosphate-sugar epimerase